MLLLPLKQLNKLVESFSTNIIRTIKLDNAISSNKKKIESPFACCITYNHNTNSDYIFLLDLLGMKVIDKKEVIVLNSTNVYFTLDGKCIKGVNNYNHYDYIDIISFIKDCKVKEPTYTPLQKWYLQFISTREFYLSQNRILLNPEVIPANCMNSFLDNKIALFNSLKSMIDNYPIN